MPWREFIFSDHPRHRLLRHLLFWSAWWLYFFVIYWYNQNVGEMAYDRFIKLGSHIFIKSFFLLFIQAIASYSFIYVLLPRFLVKSKWLKLAAGILLLSLIIFIAGYCLHAWFYPIIDLLFDNQPVKQNANIFWISASTGLLNTPKVVAAAAGIKLMKYWWLKQKEKEKLEREKINTELQLLKAQIRPSLLFNALNNIYAYSLAGSPRASEMLLKLSYLLSYMLYECDQPLVPLEKEIEMMKEYMALEKIRMAENLEMQILVKGDTQNKFIAPFLLLPFIENSFKHCNTMTEKCWISLEIKVEEKFYLVKLINGIPPETIYHPDLYGTGLANVQKRLNLLYPGNHELKITVEEEVFLVSLKIGLTEEGEQGTFKMIDEVAYT